MPLSYQVEWRESAVKDLELLPTDRAAQILDRVQRMRENLSGDVKRLKNHDPGWRLRVGIYRVLFDLEGTSIKIRRVVHRKDAYD
jgi:mRNA interferase RelE/StbE